MFLFVLPLYTLYVLLASTRQFNVWLLDNDASAAYGAVDKNREKMWKLLLTSWILKKIPKNKFPIRQNSELGKIANGKNPEWDKIPNWQNLELSKIQKSKIPNRTKSWIDKIQKWTKNPAWTKQKIFCKSWTYIGSLRLTYTAKYTLSWAKEPYNICHKFSMYIESFRYGSCEPYRKCSEVIA